MTCVYMTVEALSQHSDVHESNVHSCLEFLYVMACVASYPHTHPRPRPDVGLIDVDVCVRVHACVCARVSFCVCVCSCVCACMCVPACVRVLKFVCVCVSRSCLSGAGWHRCPTAAPTLPSVGPPHCPQWDRHTHT